MRLIHHDRYISGPSKSITDTVKHIPCFIYSFLGSTASLYEHVKTTHFFEQDSILVNVIKEKVQLVNLYLLFQTMFVLFLFKLILSFTQPVILFHVAL